ncbi:MAG: Haloacid dehalogenase domain protein hydrolase, partial [Solirubrobacterales bacterium]|nr:Haloacid dehalogenase domain protein hydrolase [Solirubrobacterales bacterium]
GRGAGRGRGGLRVSTAGGTSTAAPAALDRSAVRTVLCDADGNLFPSEEPAFVASTVVVNRVMVELGSAVRHEPEALRLATTGRNFRTTIAELATQIGARPTGEQLEAWVAQEHEEVSAHLARTLRPDPEMLAVLTRLEERFGLAAVSSSALGRLDACFQATGLARLFPPELRFSAEDSLPQPRSKPDPAVYLLALERLGLAPGAAVAVEDSLPGVRAAVAAGIPTVGNVRFVPDVERPERVRELREAGAAAIVASWPELEQLLAPAD